MRRGRSRVAIGSGARGIPYRAQMAKRLRCGPVIYARYGGDGVVASHGGAEAATRSSYAGLTRVSIYLRKKPSRGWVAGSSPATTPAFRYFANLYAPPFSIERWKAGRACMRESHALRFGYGPSLSNTFAISPTKLIWISAPVSVSPTKNCLPFSARST